MINDVGIIGLCILDLDNEKRCSVADKIYKAVTKAGYKLVWFTYFEETNCLAEVAVTFGMLNKSFLDGMIVYGETDSADEIARDIIKGAIEKGVPVVSIGSLTGASRNYHGEASDKLVEEAVAGMEEFLPHVKKIPEAMLEPDDCEETIITPDDISRGEDRIYYYVNKMLEAKSVKELAPSISGILPMNSYFCFNGEFLKQYDDADWDDEKYRVIPGEKTSDYITLALARTKVLPEAKKWLYSRDCFVLTPAVSKDIVCGYYAYRIHNMDFFRYRCRSGARFMNIALNVYIKNMQNKRILNNMENYLFLDTITGLPSLKDVSQWFEEIASIKENHEKKFAFTVFSLPEYANIYGINGADAIENVLRIVTSKLQLVYEKTGYISRVQSDQFVVINSYGADEDAIAETESKLHRFYEEMKKYHTRNMLEYNIVVNSGYTIADPGWNGTLEVFVKYAASDMYLHTLNQGKGKIDKDETRQKDTYSSFDSLIRDNLITYNFQPIIEAKTGNIYGYEALMRSGGGISMSPLEILDVAKKHNRLYDVEQTTLFNILKRFSDNQDLLQSRKVFINTIPGHFLSEEDRTTLKQTYGSCLEKVVFEVTEQDSISDEELASIRSMSSEANNAKIAVDDYGTGHSNIVNLLRYSPQIIKIDRYLISEIQNDTNKQMFVKSTIEFASINKIKVLAEGVETFEELQTVLEYGVDLIQGYYVSRPAPEFVDKIPEKVRQEILNENLRISSYEREDKAYKAKDGETMNLIDLAMEQYLYISLESGKYTICGDKNTITDMHIVIEDNSKVELTINDINVRGSIEAPMMIGTGSELFLNVVGVNSMNKEGIRVPESATLKVVGDGTLNIFLSRNYGVGIGGGYKGAFGSVVIDMAGVLDMSCSGDRVVGFGGEKSDGRIDIINGSVLINGTGISILDMGSVDGNTEINIMPGTNVDLFSNGNDSVAIGSIKGKAKLNIKGKLRACSDGERTVAIGSLFGEGSEIIFDGADIDASTHCDSGSVIGTYNGNTTVEYINSDVDIYGEGSRVTGIGSVCGKCTSVAESGSLKIKVLSGMANILGSRGDSLEAKEGVITVIASVDE